MAGPAWNGAEPCSPTQQCREQGHLIEVDALSRSVCVTCGLAWARAELEEA